MILIRIRRGWLSSWIVDDEWFYPSAETDQHALVLMELRKVLRRAVRDEDWVERTLGPFEERR